MMFLVGLLLLSALAAAEDMPAHCRHPEDTPTGENAENFVEGSMYCQTALEEVGLGEDECEFSQCLIAYLKMTDERMELKPNAVADFLFGEGYEESKEYFAGLLNDCIKNSSESEDNCELVDPLDCAMMKYLEACGDYMED